MYFHSFGLFPCEPSSDKYYAEEDYSSFPDMETQLQRPYGQTDDDSQDLRPVHSVVEDEGEPHHEKKSVLKKVKDKAKKIKNTLKKHGHGHEHEHEHDQEGDDHDEEEEEEDEETFEDPEVHGAPIYESAAIRSAAVPSQGINLEKPTAVGEDRYATKGSDEVAARPEVQGPQQYPPGSGMDLGRPTTLEVAHAAEDRNGSFHPEIHGIRVSHPSATDKKDEILEQQGARIGILEALEDDPNYAGPGIKLPSNYETKVTDPTHKGGEEAEMSPLIRSLDKMIVSDESEPKREPKWEQSGTEGSHDQFAQQPFPTADEFAPQPSTTFITGGTDELAPRSYDPSKPEELPRDTLTGKLSDESGCVEKISAATSVVADKAISAKNAVASKVGIGGTEGAESVQGKEAVKSASPTEYAHKVAVALTEKLAPVYDKVADAGSSMVSKVAGATKAGKDERPQMSNEGEGKVAADKGVSVKEHLAEKFKPREEDKALSEVISETLHKKKGETGDSKDMGKVTESEEVAWRLGSGTENEREGEDAIAAGRESSGKGVVDRIKDAVGLWVSKGTQEKHSPGSPDSSGTDAVRQAKST